MRQPVGVILSLVPWNGPVVLATLAIAYSIACGNCVILRASETSLRTHMLVAEALVEAGLPPGVLNVLTSAPEEAPQVVVERCSLFLRLRWSGSGEPSQRSSQNKQRMLQRPTRLVNCLPDPAAPLRRRCTHLAPRARRAVDPSSPSRPRGPCPSRRGGRQAASALPHPCRSRAAIVPGS